MGSALADLVEMTGVDAATIQDWAEGIRTMYQGDIAQAVRDWRSHSARLLENFIPGASEIVTSARAAGIPARELAHYHDCKIPATFLAHMATHL